MVLGCDHSEEKHSEYLKCFDSSGYEVYRCECGALINIADPHNESWDLHTVSMSQHDITVMMRQILAPIEKDMRAAATALAGHANAIKNLIT